MKWGGEQNGKKEATINTSRNAICSADSKQMVIAGALKEKTRGKGRKIFFPSFWN